MGETTAPDEAAQIRAACAGDHAAFEVLVHQHLRHVRTFVALRAPVPQLIDEIAHETFVFAFRNLGLFTPGTSLRAWLRAIASNLLRAEVQRHAREHAGQLKYAERIAAKESVSPAAPDRSGPEVEALDECVRRLPPAMRQLLQLKYGDSMESDAIARIMNRTAAWVRTTLFRLRQSLRACVESRLSLSAGGPS